MLRNLNRSAAGRRILGTPQVGLLASIIAAETAVGDNGAGLLYNEAIAAGNAGKQLRLMVTTLPAAGTLFVYENGAFDFSGAPDGSYSIGYDWYADNVLGGSDVSTINVGVSNAAAAGAVLSGTGTIAPGAASGASSAPGTSLSGSGTIAAGTAVGESGSAAPGAVLSGTSSMAAGTATGTQGSAAPGTTLTGASTLAPGAASGTVHAAAPGATLDGAGSISAGAGSGVPLGGVTIAVEVMSSRRLVGQVARLTAEIADIDDRPVDPTALLLRVKTPGGSVTDHAWPGSATLVRTGVGVFHADIALVEAGTYAFRFESPPPLMGASERTLKVNKSLFV